MWFLWKCSVTKAMSHSSQAIRIQADICTVCVCVCLCACEWCLLCGLQRDASPSPLRRDFIFTWIRYTRGDEIFALYNKGTEKIVCHSGEGTVLDPPYQVIQRNRKSGQHFNVSYAAAIWRETHLSKYHTKTFSLLQWNWRWKGRTMWVDWLGPQCLLLVKSCFTVALSNVGQISVVISCSG